MINRSTNGVAQPGWIDLVSSELENTTVLYETLFGWRAGDASPAHGGHFMFIRDGAPKDTPFGRRAVVRDSSGVIFRVTE
ncbi:MAG TPA: hypothetical protein PLG60_04475 [Acidimicrobiales bacterium]|nr:hypothetical protein [Acidimicrobiales bacterium]